MSGSTLDDPLSIQYEKLGCSISALENNSDDYKMVLNYLEKTYEPVKAGDTVSIYAKLNFRIYILKNQK